MLTWKIMQSLLDDSGQTFLDLAKIYGRLPETRCMRQGRCCALLPEMTFAEAMSAFYSLSRLDAAKRKGVFTRLVGYFFLNACEISTCPFLEGNRCLIYSKRFFGCRAYGLWSPEHYEKRAAMNRQAKKHLQDNWRRLGVSLPEAVIRFHSPYCLHVSPLRKEGGVDDGVLEGLGDAVALLSAQYGHQHHQYVHDYFSDISFLAAALVFGRVPATRMKFGVVREILSTGNRAPLTHLLEGIRDPLSRT